MAGATYTRIHADREEIMLPRVRLGAVQGVDWSNLGGLHTEETGFRQLKFGCVKLRIHILLFYIGNQITSLMQL